MRKVKYRNMRFRHEYIIFEYAMSKIIGNSLKQQALNGRMARRI